MRSWEGRTLRCDLLERHALDRARDQEEAGHDQEGAVEDDVAEHLAHRGAQRRRRAKEAVIE